MDFVDSDDDSSSDIDSVHPMIDSLHSELDANLEKKTHQLNELMERLQIPQYKYCHPDNLQEDLNAFHQEFELIGMKFEHIHTSDHSTAAYVCDRMFRLLNKLKKTKQETSEIQEEVQRLKWNAKNIQKTVTKLTAEIEEKRSQIASLDTANHKLKSTLHIATTEIGFLKTSSEKLKKQQLSTESQRQRQVKKSAAEMHGLQDKFRGRCGVFISKENMDSKELMEIKRKELDYQHMISKLEENNMKLLHENLNLKEDIVRAKYAECSAEQND